MEVAARSSARDSDPQDNHFSLSSLLPENPSSKKERMINHRMEYKKRAASKNHLSPDKQDPAPRG